MATSNTKTPVINNDLYNDLGDRWYTDDRHAIALLRAEGKRKARYIISILHRENISTNSPILDIACGGGIITNALARAQFSVRGIDCSASSIEVAQRFAPDNDRAIFEVGDAYNLPYEDSSQSAVLMLDCLEHFDDPKRSIEEASRVLRPGGLFFYHTFNRTWIANLLAVKALEILTFDTPKHVHIYDMFIKPKELEGFLHQHDIGIIEEHGLRPRFGNIAFWQSLLQRRLHKDFEFVLSRSKAVGYIGYARKNGERSF